MNLRRKLAEKIDEPKRQRPSGREETNSQHKEEIERVSSPHARAKALTVSQGRTYATMGDYRECNDVPRQVEKIRTLKR